MVGSFFMTLHGDTHEQKKGNVFKKNSFFHGKVETPSGADLCVLDYSNARRLRLNGAVTLGVPSKLL